MAGRRGTTRRNGGSGWGRTLLGVSVVFLLGFAGAAAFVALTPYGPITETFVEILPGSSTVHIGRQLKAAGIIRSQIAFDAMHWIEHGTLKAGDYRFDHPAPVSEVYDRIRRGDIYTIAVTIPEGANVYDIAMRLQQAGFGPAQKFIDTATQEASLVADVDPQAKTLEGYLFPDTYKIGPQEQMPQIAATMVKRFRVAAAQIGLNHDVHRIVTLASLVERETAVDGERRLVASVFFNRLDKQMPLMTDPSVIYGLEAAGDWRGVIHQSDLQRDTPYNTYLHPGLPPGPIANPGIRSLRAAMSPAQTDYLYFVAASENPQGKSLFATTLEGHNKNVAAFRAAQKQAAQR